VTFHTASGLFKSTRVSQKIHTNLYRLPGQDF